MLLLLGRMLSPIKRRVVEIAAGASAYFTNDATTDRYYTDDATADPYFWENP